MLRRAVAIISAVLCVGFCSGSVPIDFTTCPNACGGSVQNMINKGVGPTIAIVACTCNPSKSVFLMATNTSPTPTDISESFYNFVAQNSDTIKAYFSTDACGQDTDAFLKVLQSNPDLTACSSSSVGDVCSQDCADQLGAFSSDCASSNPGAFGNQQLLQAFEQQGLSAGEAMVKIQGQCAAQQAFDPSGATPSPTPTPTPSPTPSPTPIPPPTPSPTPTPTPTPSPTPTPAPTPDPGCDTLCGAGNVDGTERYGGKPSVGFLRCTCLQPVNSTKAFYQMTAANSDWMSISSELFQTGVEHMLGLNALFLTDQCKQADVSAFISVAEVKNTFSPCDNLDVGGVCDATCKAWMQALGQPCLVSRASDISWDVLTEFENRGVSAEKAMDTVYNQCMNGEATGPQGAAIGLVPGCSILVGTLLATLALM